MAAAAKVDTRAWKPRAIPFGHTRASLQSAYEHARPGSDGHGMTIATVQFSGWVRSDLDTYAAAAGVTLAPGQIVEIEIGAAQSHITDGFGGDFEVALDQETLLAAAPKARQRIYFGENSYAAAVALYSAIADDVLTAGIDTVSTSWGACERLIDESPATRAALDAQIDRIVANGATLFAPSGDVGAFDCSSPSEPDNTLEVDYPAANANVVGVGGSRLYSSGGAWVETPWSEPQAGPYRGDASGGGVSRTTPRPAYQSGVGPVGSKRMVPDVAALAAPDKGMGIYASTYDGWVLGGGTSASAPLWAGHLAAALSARNRTTGLGFINDKLYAQRTVAFNDLVGGNNFHYTAVAGYDLVTGLGSPRWDRLSSALLGEPIVRAPRWVRSTTFAISPLRPPGVTYVGYAAGEWNAVTCASPRVPSTPTSVTLAAGADGNRRLRVIGFDAANGCHIGEARVLLDRKPPTVTATGGLTTGLDGRVTFRWTGTDTAPASGIARYAATVRALPSGSAVWSTPGTNATSVTLRLSPGTTYELSVRAIDRAGNTGATRTTKVAVPYDQVAFTSRGPGWSGRLDARTYGGSIFWARTPGIWMHKYLTGRTYDLLVATSNNRGYVDVYVNGVRTARVDTYSATPVFRKYVRVFSSSTTKSRLIRLVVVGAHRPGSADSVVHIDGIRVLR